MNFNLKVSVLATIVVIVLLAIIYARRERNESILGLKLIGYYLLGSFVFNVNGVPVPLGFLVYLLVFRPPVNAAVKRYAAVLGLIFALLGRFLPL